MSRPNDRQIAEWLFMLADFVSAEADRIGLRWKLTGDERAGAYSNRLEDLAMELRNCAREME